MDLDVWMIVRLSLDFIAAILKLCIPKNDNNNSSNSLVGIERDTVATNKQQ